MLYSNELTEELLRLQDPDYKKFQSKLLPTVAPEKIIGVRMPALRSLAKKYAGSSNAQAFLNLLPHRFYDEDNLHAALIDYGKYDFETTLNFTEHFLPHIDNWATCDMFCPKALNTRPDEMLLQIRKWLQAEHPYTVRFALNCLMRNYLNDRFDSEEFRWINEIKHSDYYVKMGIAWYYSVAFVQQWNATLELFECGLPDPWIQNKSIQKAVESFRLCPEQKEQLKKLKIKEK